MSRLLKALGYVGMSGLLLLIVPGAAHAVTFTFNTCGTGGPTGNCGSGPVTFTSGGYTIIATAFTPSSNPGNLFAKNDGGDEVGLGLTNNGTQNEITAGSFIQLNLDVSGGVIPVVPLTIVMDSTTSPDEWELYETNTAGASSGTVDAHGFNEAAFTIDPQLDYLDVTALNGNVLLSSLSFSVPSQTPEPSGLALLGTGILGLAGVMRRKLKM